MTTAAPGRMAQNLLVELQTALSSLPALRLEAAATGTVKAAFMDGTARCVVALKEAGIGLSVTASICQEQHANPRKVLVEAAKLTGQTVALVEGRYLVRIVVSGAGREPAALRQAVLSLAQAAREMTRALTEARPQEDNVVFSHYTM